MKPTSDCGFIVTIKTNNIRITMTLTERLNKINSNLTEASEEITAKIEILKQQDLDEEGMAALEAIEQKAQALADIVPNVPEPGTDNGGDGTPVDPDAEGSGDIPAGEGN